MAICFLNKDLSSKGNVQVDVHRAVSVASWRTVSTGLLRCAIKKKFPKSQDYRQNVVNTMGNHCAKTKKYFQDPFVRQVLRQLGVQQPHLATTQINFSPKVFRQKRFIGVKTIWFLPIQAIFQFYQPPEGPRITLHHLFQLDSFLFKFFNIC